MLILQTRKLGIRERQGPSQSHTAVGNGQEPGIQLLGPPSLEVTCLLLLQMFLVGEKDHASRYPSHPGVLLKQEASQTVTFTTETQRQKLVAPTTSRAFLPKMSAHPLFFSDHLLLSQVLSSTVQGEKRLPSQRRWL